MGKFVNRTDVIRIFIAVIMIVLATRIGYATYLYQENANASAGYIAEYDTALGLLDINYTKITNANINSSWLIRYGNAAAQNISIPLDCWNYDANKLVFRVESHDTGTQKGYSDALCRNTSTSWRVIGTKIEAPSHISDSTCDTAVNPNVMYDGDWITYAYHNGQGGDDCWQTTGGDYQYAGIYEEAMWWDYNATSLTVNWDIYSPLNNSLVQNNNETQHYYFNYTGVSATSANCTFFFNSTGVSTQNNLVSNTVYSFSITKAASYVYNISNYVNCNASNGLSANTSVKVTRWNLTQGVLTNLSAYSAPGVKANFYVNLTSVAIIAVTQCGIYTNNTNVSCSQNDTINNNTQSYCDIMTYQNGASTLFTPYCLNSSASFNGTTQELVIDNVVPTITTIYTNNYFYWMNNLTAQFNLSDNFLIYDYNITIDGVQVAYLNNINLQVYILNFTYNVSNLATGKHNLTIRIYDAHTAREIQDMEVSRGIFHDVLRYDYDTASGTKGVELKRADSSIFDTFTTVKETDKYTWTFDPAGEITDYDLEVKADEKINIINAPETKYKTWLIFGKRWMDFDIQNGEKGNVEIEAVDDNNVIVHITNMQGLEVQKFESIGELNMKEASYSFYTYNATANTYATMIEGGTVTLTLNLSMPNISLYAERANLTFNDTKYTAGTKTYASDGSSLLYSKSITPYSATGAAAMNWTWYFNITNDTGAYTSSIYKSAGFLPLNITNCSNSNYTVLNYTVYDETTKAMLKPNETTIETQIFMYIQQNPNVYYNFSVTVNSNNLSICLPNNTLATTMLGLNSITKYSSTNYVTEYYYIDNLNLSSATIPKQIALYDLNTTLSTTYLITYQDENYIYKTGYIVDLLRKYVGDFGLFYSVENGKTDDGGQTRLHLVSEDVIYKFNVWNGQELVYSSGEYLALCQATPCLISLRKEVNTSTATSQLQNIVYSMTDDATFQTSKQIEFLYSTKDHTASKVDLVVTKSTYLYNDTICNNTITTSSGTVICLIPVGYQNASYTARIYKDGEILGHRDYSLKTSAKDAFGDTGLFMTAVAYLLLALMGVTSPVVSILLGIVGLAMCIMVNLIFFQGSFIGIGSTFIWIIIAGVIVIYKLTERRVS